MTEAYLPKQETLLTELRTWKNIEKSFGGVHEEEPLKSRRFEKLKMRTYQQLYSKYKGASLSVDEKALHPMLRYQYKQIEHKLYPNALVRLSRHAWSAIQLKAVQLIKGSPSREAFDVSKEESIISSGGPVNADNSSIVTQNKHEIEQNKLAEGWRVNVLGQREKDNNRDKGKGLGLH